MSHVVLVENNRKLQETLVSLLMSRGFTVGVAHDCPTALVALRRDKPLAAVISMELPGVGGLGCVESIRAFRDLINIPVFVIATAPSKASLLRAAQLKVAGVLLRDDGLAARLLARLANLGGPRSTAVPNPPSPVVVTASESPPAARPSPAASIATKSTLGISEADEVESMRSSVLQLDGDTVAIEQATLELKALKPMVSRSDLLKQIEGEDLRAIKPAVQRVLALTGGSEAIDTIAKAIKQDQALALKVLKVANSPVYTRGERVETVHKAVSRIGIEQIRTTVMSLGVIDRFGSVQLAGRIQADWFWEHSIACGLIASQIAQLRGLKSDAVDSMFTAGLLHDVGRSIYAERLGDRYAEVIAIADRLEMPLETVESRLLLINHADLTDRLLRQWNFSPELINPIALHHLSVGNIRRVAPRMAEAVATLGLANRLAHALLLGSSGNEVIYPIEEFVSFLGLTPHHIEDLCATVPEQTADMTIQMLAHGGSPGMSALERTRSNFPARPHPLVAAMEPRTAVSGILMRRLSTAGPAEAPNLAVIRIVDARERTSVLSRLQQAEAAEGVRGLPALVVATGPSGFFAEGALGDRRVEQVTLPLRLSRLVRVVNQLLAH